MTHDALGIDNPKASLHSTAVVSASHKLCIGEKQYKMRFPPDIHPRTSVSRFFGRRLPAIQIFETTITHAQHNAT